MSTRRYQTKSALATGRDREVISRSFLSRVLFPVVWVVVAILAAARPAASQDGQVGQSVSQVESASGCSDMSLPGAAAAPAGNGAAADAAWPTGLAAVDTSELRSSSALPDSWVLVGTATGQIGWRPDQQPPLWLDPRLAAKSGGYRDGQAAFFARGPLGNGFFITTSYDSDRRHRDRVFRYLTPERVFPIYGDASSIFYEAQSAVKLFVGVTGNGFSTQYGDFSTNLSSAELATYNRSLTGVSSSSQGKRLSTSLFAVRTDQATQIDELPGEGISGYYYLSASKRGIAIVEGSERIVIQTRDRLHPEIVLREELRLRFSDYEIDYLSGTLLFKRPVPAHSPDEHPIVIRATYETARALDKSWVGGGRVELRPGDSARIGVTAVGEERAGRDYWLTGVEMRLNPLRDATITSEVAHSDWTSIGTAWKVGMRGNIGQPLSYDVYYRDAEKTFSNPYSSTALPGVRKVRGRLSWSPLSALTLTGESFQTRDSVNDEDRESASLGARHHWKTVGTSASMEATKLSRRGDETRSTILSAGTEWAAASRMTLTAARDQAFGDPTIAYRPTLNRLGAQWRLTDRLSVVAEHSFRDKSFTDSSLTTVGFKSQFADDLTAYANYELANGINGERNQAIVGLRHRYRPSADVSLDASLERMQTLRGDSQADFLAYGLGGEYLPGQPLKASARLERRDGRTLDKTVATGAADFTIGSDLALLAKHTYLTEIRAGTGTTMRSGHLLSGLSFRPVARDLINGLGKYEYTTQYNGQQIPFSTRASHIGSLEFLLEPRSQVEWFVRYAAKLSRLSSEGVASRAVTDLWMTNVRYEWSHRWDIVGEYRLLSQYVARDRQHGAAFELGVTLQKNSRLALGYNLTGYQDEDFAGQAYWAHGPYLKVQAKLTESDVAGVLNGLQSARK